MPPAGHAIEELKGEFPDYIDRWYGSCGKVGNTIVPVCMMMSESTKDVEAEAYTLMVNFAAKNLARAKRQGDSQTALELIFGALEQRLGTDETAFLLAESHILSIYEERLAEKS